MIAAGVIVFLGGGPGGALTVPLVAVILLRVRRGPRRRGRQGELGARPRLGREGRTVHRRHGGGNQCREVAVGTSGTATRRTNGTRSTGTRSSNYTCTFTVWDSAATFRDGARRRDRQDGAVGREPAVAPAAVIVAFGALATAFAAPADAHRRGVRHDSRAAGNGNGARDRRRVRGRRHRSCCASALVAATLLFAGLAMVRNLYVRITLIVSIGISGLLVYMWW